MARVTWEKWRASVLLETLLLASWTTAFAAPGLALVPARPQFATPTVRDLGQYQLPVFRVVALRL